MSKVEEVLKSALGTVNVLEGEEISTIDAMNRVLAEDIFSPVAIPQFNRATMDGYAVRGEDTSFASRDNPAVLELVGMQNAGEVKTYALGHMQAVRVATGSPLPEGSDAVARREITGEENGYIKIFREVKPGKDVSLIGEDIKKGSKVLSRGTFLKSFDLGILAGMGLSKVKVIRKPRVALIVTGDEVVEPGKELKPGEIYDMNTYTFYNEIIASGAEPVYLGIVKDEYSTLKKVILQAGTMADLVITTGGSSRGEKDFIPKIIDDIGKRWAHFMPIKPGKPMAFGTFDGKPIFALSGWTAAAWVTFDIFVRPLIHKMGGRLKSEGQRECRIKALLDKTIKSKIGRRDFVRVTLVKNNGSYIAHELPYQRSSILTSIVRAHGIVDISEERDKIPEGEVVEVKLLREL